jgi:predicted RNase H-like HicB family nuclease
VIDARRPDLAALGAELQAELRLLDWQVTYVYVPNLADADGNAVYGLCDRLVDNKTATIAIRDPLASKPLPEGAEDKTVESILMHELVHLHVAPLAVTTPQGIVAEEQAVWPIAEALTKWRGTARGEMVARAMSLRGRQRVGRSPARENRSMNRSELAMLKAAMGDGKDPEAAMKNMKAAIEAYEKTMPEEGAGEPDGDEAKKAAAARAAEVEEEGRKAAAARSAEPPTKAAAMTIADVDQRAAAVAARVVGEHAERSALISANAAHFNAAEVAFLNLQPLPTVKSLVAARLTGAPSATQGNTQRAAGIGPIGPVPADALAACPAGDRADTEVAIRRMAKLMGLETTAHKAVEITERGRKMALSHLGDFRAQFQQVVAAEQRGAGGGR